MARLYSNENFPIPAVVAPRALGHDVVTIQERGNANESTSDSEVVRLATADSRIVLTLNRKDFYREHDRNREHAGIIVCVADEDFQRLAQQIHDRIQAEEDLARRIIHVPPRT